MQRRAVRPLQGGPGRCDAVGGQSVVPAGGAPLDFFELSGRLAEETSGCPEALATGRPGDVWLCHPFVVHSAQPHRGQRPRFMAQPPLAGAGPIDASRPAGERSAVEEAVARALASQESGTARPAACDG